MPSLIIKKEILTWRHKSVSFGTGWQQTRPPQGSHRRVTRIDAPWRSQCSKWQPAPALCQLHDWGEAASWPALRSCHLKLRRQHGLQHWHLTWAWVTGEWRRWPRRAAGGYRCCRRWSCTEACSWDRRLSRARGQWVGKSTRRCADWRWFQNQQLWGSCRWRLQQ